VDLSVGTPVDPTPAAAVTALAGASDSPGYPATAGTAQLRAALVDWLRRRLGVDVVDEAVLPTIGSKELVASLPRQLGVRPADVVAFPQLAYPTYEVGARLAGARPVPVEDVTELDPHEVALVWLNSPANPHGAVLGADALRRVVDWARTGTAVVASDECYLEFGWEGTEPVSLLHPDVCSGRHDRLLAVHSLSKRSNLAGYRAGFVAGDANLVRDLLEVRRHAGLIVPGPVQAAMAAVLDDDAHVAAQRDRYRGRRDQLKPALTAAGFAVEQSGAGLYLWASRGESCWDSVGWLADRGILVAPGEFYGPPGKQHIRVALTATDERVAAAAERLRVAG
jgi:succinyldiaminopimelate transaminase